MMSFQKYAVSPVEAQRTALINGDLTLGFPMLMRFLEDVSDFIACL